MKCPNKIRHFTWRACRNILPTKSCLLQGKVVTADKCDFCGEKETSGHILWGCKIAKDAWELSSKLGNTNITPELFVDVFWLLQEDKNEKDWELIATVAWSLWNNRNTVRHGGQSKQGKAIATDARRYVDKFRVILPSNPFKPPPISKRWSPPPAGWYKVNVDGDTFKEQRNCGVEVVIRNEKDQMMGAISKKIHYPSERWKQKRKQWMKESYSRGIQASRTSLLKGTPWLSFTQLKDLTPQLHPSRRS